LLLPSCTGAVYTASFGAAIASIQQALSLRVFVESEEAYRLSCSSVIDIGSVGPFRSQSELLALPSARNITPSDTAHTLFALTQSTLAHYVSPRR
jgi:hypothetical protein